MFKLDLPSQHLHPGLCKILSSPAMVPTSASLSVKTFQGILASVQDFKIPGRELA